MKDNQKLLIQVARKGQGIQGVYVGRPTPLGNPFRLLREEDRDEVVARYATWLKEQLRRGNPEVIRALESTGLSSVEAALPWSVSVLRGGATPRSSPKS
jgi:hypothetical protein